MIEVKERISNIKEELSELKVSVKKSEEDKINEYLDFILDFKKDINSITKKVNKFSDDIYSDITESYLVELIPDIDKLYISLARIVISIKKDNQLRLGLGDDFKEFIESVRLFKENINDLSIIHIQIPNDDKNLSLLGDVSKAM